MPNIADPELAALYARIEPEIRRTTDILLERVDYSTTAAAHLVDLVAMRNELIKYEGAEARARKALIDKIARELEIGGGNGALHPDNMARMDEARARHARLRAEEAEVTATER